jgi:chorismate mutase
VRRSFTEEGIDLGSTCRRTVAVICGIAAVVGCLCAAGAPARSDALSPLNKLVDDAANRLQTADPVAASKYSTGDAVDDPAREQQVIDSVTADAVQQRVDSDYVDEVFRDQIDATDSVEHSRFAQWKIDPAHAPTAAPDLSDSRAAIDTLNHAIVDDIGMRWDLLHSPACRADLNEATSQVMSSRYLDQIFQRALTYATHRFCR